MKMDEDRFHYKNVQGAILLLNLCAINQMLFKIVRDYNKYKIVVRVLRIILILSWDNTLLPHLTHWSQY